MEKALLEMKVKSEQLEINLAHAQAQVNHQEELPKEIELTIVVLGKLKDEHIGQEKTVGKNAEAAKIAKDAREIAANDPRVVAVKDKQDFLNKAVITHDAGDGD